MSSATRTGRKSAGSPHHLSLPDRCNASLRRSWWLTTSQRINTKGCEMLAHEKPRKIDKITTTDSAEGRHQRAAGSERPEFKRPARRPLRPVLALVATGALIGIAVITILAQSYQDQNTATTSDGSHEQAETNRFNRLTPNASTDRSHEQAETNRFAALRDFVSP